MLAFAHVDSFYDRSHILHDVCLEVPEGKVTAVLGRNGTGKTTLLKTLMGLTDRMDGEIRLDEADLAGQEVDRPDAAGCDAPGTLGDLVADVGGGHHRLGSFDAGLVLDPTEDSSLASVQQAVDIGVHSKTSWGERTRLVKYLDCSL